MKKILLILSAILVLCCGTYYNMYYVNTKQLNVREETIVIDQSNNKDELVIAYFSDLNYGEWIDDSFTRKIMEQINLFQPDLIVFGGNLINSQFADQLTQEDIQQLITLLSSLKCTYGKIAVMGEDDLVLDQTVKDIYDLSDFQILNNKSLTIETKYQNFINIVGIDPLYTEPDLSDVFSELHDSSYVFVFSHCPDLYDRLLSYDFDYFAAGHSRGGQIYIPVLNLFFRDEGCKKYYKGKTIKNHKTLDITNGIGRMRINARLFSDAEIVLYTLKYE